MQAFTHWIEIDLDALVYNFHSIRQALPGHLKILAVVKADGYGLGGGPVAKLFENEGVDMLGVTHLAEGILLRREGVTAPVLLFAPLLPQEAGEAARYRLTPTIDSLETARALQEALAPGQVLDVHIKIETGMGRTGLKPAEVLPFCRRLLEECPGLRLEGLYTHFARPAPGDTFTQQQLTLFKTAIESLQAASIEIPLKHAAGSTAALVLPEAHFDMVRLGTVLYGQKPPAVRNSLSLRNPWQPKARILHIQELPKGAGVGYGRDYRLKKATRIGVIPYGYADGLGVTAVARPKNLGDLMKTLVKTVLAYWGKGPQALGVRSGEHWLPIVGRIGMQLSMIEIGDLPLKENDIVSVPLGRITASPDLPRVYLREGQVVAVRTPARQAVSRNI